MNRRIRSLLILGISLAGCVVFAAGAVFVRYGHRWCPGIVIAWSPFVDQTTRAMVVQAARNPAGVDYAAIVAWIGRFPSADIAALVGTSDAATARAILVLEARISKGDPSAASFLMKIAGNSDWMVRHALAQSGCAASVEIIESLCNDPHPAVALAACECLIQWTAKSSKTEEVRAALEYRCAAPLAEIPVGGWLGMGPSAGHSHIRWLAGDEPDAVFQPGYAGDLKGWEARAKQLAWPAFAAVAAADCAAEMRQRWTAWSTERRQEGLRCFAKAGNGAEDWLVEVALTDDELAEAAIVSLVSQAARRQYISFRSEGLPALKALATLRASRHAALVDGIIGSTWGKSGSTGFFRGMLRLAQADGYLADAVTLIPSAQRISVLDALKEPADRALVEALRAVP